MNRRDITRSLGAAAALACLGPVAQAQGGPVEGRDFVKLNSPLPVTAGKVEVVEFFGYWCPHCNAFEPTLDAWARKINPAQVDFRRLSVAFNASQEPLQRLYYAFEALGLVEAMHRKVFTAIHATKTLSHSAKDADIAAFVQTNGGDSAKVLDAMKSFSVATKVRQSRQLAEGYGLDAIPTLGVQGRWRTSPSMAGGPAQVLAVVDTLIAQSRKG